MQGYYYTIPFTSTDKFDTSPCGNFSHPKYAVSKASAPYVRFSSKSSSDSASFSPPLVVVSKRKSFIVHIHAPLAAARHRPNNLVCRSLRSPCTNVRTVLKRDGSVLRETEQHSCLRLALIWRRESLLKIKDNLLTLIIL